MAVRGARLKLTPETQAAVCKSVAAGLPMVQAAVHAGVSEAALYDWLKLAKEKNADPVYVEFLQEVEKARVKALYLRIRRISKHGKTNPKADMWWCERMFADEFGADKRTVQELVQRVAHLTAELETLRAESGRAGRRAKKGRKRRPPAAENGSHI